MKKHLVLILALCMVVSVVSGCSSASAEKVYGKSDLNITVDTGKSFTIVLDENPTTGYAWVYKIGDTSIVGPVKDDYKGPSDTNRVGAGGTHTFTFKALKTGTTAIDFSYERSFEQNSSEEKLTYNVTIN